MDGHRCQKDLIAHTTINEQDSTQSRSSSRLLRGARDHGQRHHEKITTSLEPRKRPIRSVGKARGGVFFPFPQKLHTMLNEAEQGQFDHIVSWQPQGRSFKVHRPELFLSTVLPRYFKQSQLRSFHRQLNLYGFSRILSGPDRGGYFHELFLRDQMHLSTQIVRVNGKGPEAIKPPKAPIISAYKKETCNENSSHDDDADVDIERAVLSNHSFASESRGSADDSIMSVNGTECRVLTLLSPHEDIGCLPTLRQLLDNRSTGHAVGLDVQSGEETEFEGRRFQSVDYKSIGRPNRDESQDDTPFGCASACFCQQKGFEPDKMKSCHSR